MNNIELIESEELRGNLLKIKDGVIDIISRDSNRFTRDTNLVNKINKYLYNHVIGIESPIAICDSGAWINPDMNYIIELVVDYRVTSGYKPFQNLDKDIHLTFEVSKIELRNNKINKILI